MGLKVKDVTVVKGGWSLLGLEVGYGVRGWGGGKTEEKGRSQVKEGRE